MCGECNWPLNHKTISISGESAVPPISNEIDLRNLGICPECQIRVVNAIMGKSAKIIKWKND